MFSVQWTLWVCVLCVCVCLHVCVSVCKDGMQYRVLFVRTLLTILFRVESTVGKTLYASEGMMVRFIGIE